MLTDSCRQTYQTFRKSNIERHQSFLMKFIASLRGVSADVASASFQCSCWLCRASDLSAVGNLTCQPPQRCKLHCIYYMYESTVKHRIRKRMNTGLENKFSNWDSTKILYLAFGLHISGLLKATWTKKYSSLSRNSPCSSTFLCLWWADSMKSHRKLSGSADEVFVQS